MIKLGFSPRLLIVARVTFFAFLTLVFVIFFMTSNTLGLQFVFVYIAFMATAAFHFLMLEEQGVLG